MFQATAYKVQRANPAAEQCLTPIVDAGAAPHPPAGTFSSYSDGEKEWPLPWRLSCSPGDWRSHR
ncbi:hypothetical protein EOD23_08580 [Mesorhizobium sp. USDA-HM6]|nr:hypothetical protein EOD23_08580 [Mesorhizobium sp. USDA-HM6]